MQATEANWLTQKRSKHIMLTLISSISTYYEKARWIKQWSAKPSALSQSSSNHTLKHMISSTYYSNLHLPSRIEKQANIHIAIFKSIKYAYFGCDQVGWSYSYMAIWPPNATLWPVDRRFLMIEGFIANSTSCIARERHKKLTDRINVKWSRYSPDRQTEGQTHRLL